MKSMRIKDLKTNMILGQDIYSEHNLLLASKGDSINDKLIAELLRLNHEPIFIEIPDKAPLLSEEMRDKIMAKVSHSLLSYRPLSKPIFNKINLQIAECMKELLLSDDALSTLKGLSDIDEYTYNHAIHVGLLSGFIGKLLNYDHNDIINLIYAGIFHDVGKLHIDKSILLKPSKLTDSEFEQVKKHSELALSILERLPFINDDIKQGIYQHHERRDGSGYPKGIMGDDIHRYARIVGVADVYDASVSNKCYGITRSPFEACEDLFKDSLDAIDPTASQALICYLQKNYIGLSVTLSNGKEGEIVFINKFDPNKPLVKCGSEFYDLSLDSSIRIEKINA